MSTAFETELMRLLCQLALADGEAAPVERTLIFDRARAAGVDDATIAAQVVALNAGRLPAPDLALLRAHAAETRTAAHQLLAADGILADDEVAALDRLEVALAGPSRGTP